MDDLSTGRDKAQLSGWARFRSFVAWDTCPGAISGLKWVLHILEFRESANINAKQIKVLFSLTSNRNVAFPSVTNVGSKPEQHQRVW